MPKKLLMLAMSPKKGIVETSDIHDALDRALDWLQISPNCWLLFTSSDSDKWFDRIKKITEKWGDNFLIMELNPHHRQGWLKSSVWDWINERTDEVDN
ncbi:MAG: hypothetical protein ABF876_12680 [Acetobacter aceti]|nr:hypothetical protein [Acetobacter aceti]